MQGVGGGVFDGSQVHSPGYRDDAIMRKHRVYAG